MQRLFFNLWILNSALIPRALNEEEFFYQGKRKLTTTLVEEFPKGTVPDQKNSTSSPTITAENFYHTFGYKSVKKKNYFV